MKPARLAPWLGWLAALALLYPWRDLPPAVTPRPPLARRLLGPAASLAASLYWIRFDMALRDGEHDRAYVLAEHALGLAPDAAAGWYTLGRHLIFDRASLESEPDPGRRRAWIEAGLAILERGEAVTSEPGQLAYLQGSILTYYVAEIARDLEWPGGAEKARADGARALARAKQLGDSHGPVAPDDGHGH